MSRGVQFHLTGLADTAVKESYDRIKAALINNGFKMPTMDITANLSPADIKKEGSGYDLPLAMGILAANGKVESDMLNHYMMVGELGLDGRLQPIRGALPIAIQARKEKFKGLIVPKQNIREAAVVNQLEVYGMETLTDVLNFINGDTSYQPTVIDTRREFYEQQNQFEFDFSEVRLQRSAWTRECQACLGGGCCRRPQPHHDRPSRVRQVHAGKATTFHPAPAVAGRELGNHPNTLCGRQAEP